MFVLVRVISRYLNMTLFALCHFLFFGLFLWCGALISSTFASLYAWIASILLGAIIAYISLPVTKGWFHTRRVSTINKSVLITGCDSGFGHMLAKKLHDDGFEVFASCLFPDGPGAQELKRIESERLHVFHMNVTDVKSVAEAQKYVQQHLHDSELWALVNNAGVQEGFQIALTPLTCYENCFRVNTLGVVRVTKAFLPMLRGSRGRVIVLTSITGRISFPDISAYQMSKSAAICFTECLRQELQPWGIKVISVEPELFATTITDVKGIQKAYNEIIEDLDEDTKMLYGEDYLKRFQKYSVWFVSSSASSKLNKVVESLVDAVSLCEPCDVYKPCRNKFTRWIIWMMEISPRPAVDLYMRYYGYITGYPVPKAYINEVKNGKSKIH